MVNNPKVSETKTFDVIYGTFKAKDPIWSTLPTQFTNTSGTFAVTKSCVVTYSVDSTGTYVTTIKSWNGLGIVLENIYAFTEKDVLAESFYTIKNLGTNPEFDSGIALAVKETGIKKVNDLTYEGKVYSASKITVVEDESQITSYNIGYKDSNGNVFAYDFTKASDFVDEVKITKDITGTIRTDIIFYDKTGATTPNKSYTVDPLFGWSDAAVHRVTTSSSADTNCNSGSAKDQTTIMFRNDSATSGNCGVAAFEFDVTAIPDSSDIKAAQLSITIENVQNGINCDINPVTNRPSTTAASTLYTDITDGVAYVDNNNFCTTSGQKIIDLGTAFQNNVELNCLTNNWCAIGISFDSLTRGSNDHQVIFTNPSISITYGTSVVPNAPTLNSITTTGTNNLLSWTFGTNFDNSTQPAISSTKVYRGNTFYANKSLAEFGSNLESNVGAVPMSTNVLQLKFNSYKTATTFDDSHELGGGGTDATISQSSTTATFSDSFSSSSAWTQSGTPITVNTANTRIDYDGQINGVAGGRLYHDMTSISDSAFVYRFPWNVVTVTANSGSNQPYGFFGVTDNLPTGVTEPNDGIGIRWNSEPPAWTATYYDGGTATNSAWSHTPQVEQLYIEMKRTSTTSMTITLYSNSAYTTVVETKTITIPSTVTGLRYLWFADFDNTGYVSGGGRYVTQVNGQLNFYDGITSLTSGTTALVRGIYSSDQPNNGLYLSDSNLNVTASDVSTTNITVLANVNFTSNGKAQILAYKNGGTEVLFTVDPDYASISRAGVVQTNQTFSSAMGLNKVNLIGFTKNATHACIYRNNTYVGCTANSTALGTITNNLIHINSDTALAKIATIMFDDYNIFNGTLSHGDIADTYQRIVPFSHIGTVSGTGTTYTDSLGLNGATRCYEVKAVNSIGNSPPSNILCPTTGDIPGTVTNLSTPDQTTSTIDLTWSAPSANGSPLTGYRLNYTTPHGTASTILVNNTNSTSTNYVVSGLTYATNYTFRVSAWNAVGKGPVSNTLNTQTDGDTFTVGSIVVNQTNTDIVDIRFERIDINDTALFLNVTYSSTFDLACDFTYKFARINQTYTNLDNVTISSGIVESSFLFTGVDNEIIDVLCWDQDSAHVPSASVGAGAGNYTHAGRYIITQSQFPLQDQINNFRNGVYGTEGRIGVLDFITLGVIIVSMIGFNRVNETVGVVFNIILLGVLAYFEVIVLPTIIFGVLATVIVLVVSTTKKD